MRRPAVFFDRDNTLIVGNDYLGDPAQVALVAGAAGAVARCRAMGFAVVVVSNQSGVARGMFGEDAVQACNRRMDELLLQHNPGAVIDRHEYCPFHPDAKVPAYKQDSFLRKPKPGMILAAADAMALDLGRSWMVGDAPRDITAGKAAGCRTILIIDPTLAPSPAALESVAVKPDFTVTTLVEAVDLITKQSNKQPPPQNPSQQNPTQQPEPLTPTPAKQPINVTAVMPGMVIKPQPAPATTSAPQADAQAPVPMPLAAPKPQTPVHKPATPIVQSLDTSRLELLGQQILVELKKTNEAKHEDFSISKLIAGIVQVLAVAAIMLAYFLFKNDSTTLTMWLMVALFLQTFTISLLIMSRQQ